ncbi:translocation/assembly module TamB domain-containing protein [Mucilaginibacter myungsuensis]|uniref:Translocation/assembly module TamB domain-containing protein n=1 Tax=Mucilaginibacter myungsuensis TaxID=649104 RepID=A0A929L0L6_9SPHI|nr:translocation/assembly module TamB domain-containing protein [Mucilaginibacter myungsuensis]MBE9661950.1 translocation/assembly module TamB domain-containing protein [Mucilaginibacter myungsuensis]MDN3599617.1 translocation/assembly module TamB domain-containing protein [Mucilaginibacter myungsuensis]
MILLLVSVLLLVLQYKPVQTYVAKKVADHFSQEWKTKVYIGGLYVKPFSSIVLDSLYVLDKQKDTLLITPKLTVELDGFSVFSSISEKKLHFSLIELDNGSVYLKKLNDTTSNLDFIIDYFESKPKKPDTAKTPSKPWTMVFDRSVVKNFRFRYLNKTAKEIHSNAIDFDNLDVSRLSVDVRNMDLVNHMFKGDVRKLTLHEKSGFHINNLTAIATVDSNKITAEKLYLETPNSILRDYYSMKFARFGVMSEDYVNSVIMEGNFKSSQISSKDITYFTPTLDKTKFDLGIDGKIKGTVANLKATNLMVTAGQATYLKGNFKVKGLPDIESTILELDFDQVASNKKDLDKIYNDFSGTNNQKLPAIVGKFGNFNFKGRFSGLTNDFIAYGEFKTALGRFESDVNLKIAKGGRPSYSGNVKLYDFALGKLIDQPDLNRITAVADVKGSGDDLKSLTANVKSQIAYIDFNKYRYRNVKVDGSVNRQVFAGTVSVNDKNVNLHLKGTADIAGSRPDYNLTASIINARLNTLNLTKDTITLSANIDTRFSGNNLNDITGKVSLSPIRIVDPRHNYLVDSVNLTASGSGRQRLISLTSPMADGSIKGNYNVASLPDYFKSVVKKYVPSYKADIKPFKPQEFDFNLKIKDIDPLLALFVPGLSIPDKGTIVGNFDSADQQATLSGYIKTVKYGGMVLHDLILDENTTKDQLSVNVSLNQIDITKDLFIKNVNISNFIRRDSVNFNVKLSDVNATNQLDLYGLVKFGKDTAASVSILPSDVFLERQRWKIQEQVKIKFLDGKTQISGFELTNGQQKVKINGLISDDVKDQLKVEFDKFSMATLNQLTKPSGIALNGYVNGGVTLTAITKAPGVDAQLRIDSLAMNETLIGNVKIASTLDNDRSQAKVKLNILNRGLETMDISGLYNLGKDTESSFDFDIKMNQAEAVMLNPFVKGLVSNLKGHISTDIKLTGSPKEPKLNGKVIFGNTGLVVDYLKTAYTINDVVTIDNSLIKIDKLTLTDVKGGKAVVTKSTVDLRKISEPTLDITIEPKNFQALNTTFKDNHVYFGTAYATGTVKFKGPVDNMSIDINASAEEGTVFNIPLNTSSTASDYDFIRYVSHTDTTQKIESVNSFKGITLNLVLRVDEKSLVKIATDYGKLEGRGVANNLQLKINSLGDFEMFGDFQISSGKFEFTAKDFISKNFSVNQGGTIRWTSNPANADINLKAIYEVRTGINNLYTAAGLTSPQGNQQKLVQAELILTNTLLQPKIDFDFTFPTDPSIKDDLATYLRDESNRNQQALSLIVRRQFASGAGSNISDQVTQTAEQALSEFAFNKLNTLISQSNIKFADINIRSTSDASATLRFFDDRLIFNGSLYNASGSNNLFGSSGSFFDSDINNFTKDFEADYLIRPDGRLRGRYSYRVLNGNTLDFFSNQLGVQYVNGVGLVYQRDFDSIGEFLRSLFRRGRKPAAPAVTVPGNTAVIKN